MPGSGENWGPIGGNRSLAPPGYTAQKRRGMIKASGERLWALGGTLAGPGSWGHTEQYKSMSLRV